ncbi:MAG: DUF503 domain-containing protein [Armatimonadota bacterium]|nr:DUF503 domain-containing protein [Armatimonadota bacterium]
MIVGILTIDLLVVGSNSLKEKRHVVRSLLDNIRNKFNVSAAELDSLDSRRRAVIGVACISNDKAIANTMLNRALGLVESDPRAAVESSHLEFL